MIIYPGGDDPAALARRLRSLADTLAGIGAGRGPTDADLAGAPVLSDWVLTSANRPVLAGVSVGHPLLSGRRLIRTSEVYAIAPLAGWALSGSRFYLLGRGASDLGSVQ